MNALAVVSLLVIGWAFGVCSVYVWFAFEAGSRKRARRPRDRMPW